MWGNVIDIPVIRSRMDRQARRVPLSRVCLASNSVAVELLHFLPSFLSRELSLTILCADGEFLTIGEVGLHIIRVVG